MKNSKRIAVPFLAVLACVAVLSAKSFAASAGTRTDVYVKCRCADPVGQNFCAVFKQKVSSSAGYRLVSKTSTFGLGVHFSCVDLWHGIDKQLAGRMSAVAVAFTIYANGLPGEMLEDSSVFRVGKDAVPQMADRVLAALGKLVTVNAAFFDRMQQAAQASPAASPLPTP